MRPLRSSFDSSARPADSGTVSRSSFSSTSPLRSGGVPVGIRKPATYQFDWALATRQLLGAEFMARPGSNQIELDGLDETRADFEGIDRSRLRGCHGRGVPYTEREARSPAPWFQATDMFCDAERIVGLISVQAQSCRRLARTSNSSVPYRRQGPSPRVRGSHGWRVFMRDSAGSIPAPCTSRVATEAA